jgi:hypothetical protein
VIEKSESPAGGNTSMYLLGLKPPIAAISAQFVI